MSSKGSERVILKLGGSILTDKGREGIIRTDTVRAIAKAIFSALSTRKSTSLILIHGAGSCGHPEAERFSLMDGVTMANKQGLYLTHHAVRHLNDVLVQILREEGLDAVGISPIGSCIAHNGRLKTFPSEIITRLLEFSLVPVLHGDVVVDSSRGASILSGDQIVMYLAGTLSIGRVGLATDVPGVIGPDGVVMPHITRDSFIPSLKGLTKRPDVTGGMAGKVGELLHLAESSGISSEIFHADHIGDFLSGRPHGGTLIGGE